MSIDAKEKLKGTFIIPIGIFIFLVPFSLLIGWSFLTAVLFWFIIVPILTVYLPLKISKSKNHLSEAIAGLFILYGFMVFMTYKLYKTDLFKMMMISLVFNLIIVALASRSWKQV